MIIYGVIYQGQFYAVIKSLSTDTVKLAQIFAERHGLVVNDVFVYELQVLEY